MPDDAHRPAVASHGPPRPIDLADDWFNFFRVYKHRPESWPEYVMGSRHAWKADERAKLRIASAARIAADTGDSFKRWYDLIDKAVG